MKPENNKLSLLREKLAENYRRSEAECIATLLNEAHYTKTMADEITPYATELVAGIRSQRQQQGGLDAFLSEYDLSSEEGIALMCLAEALLRIPDKETIDRLISEKIGEGDWQEHRGQSHSFFVNAMTWGLMLTGRMLSPQQTLPAKLGGTLKNLFRRTGMPAIRIAVNQMMKIMSQQFVMGETIDAAIKRARETEKMGYRYSYDMLGEAAKTAADAERYFQAYQHAIKQVGNAAHSNETMENPGISVKLSALHPRYEFAKAARVIDEIMPRILSLCELAKQHNISLTIDAEEADKLELSLDIIENLLLAPSLRGWEGFGIAVQSYQKRALYLLDWLAELTRSQKRRIAVRLIKGAYWDSEIKQSQVLGLEGYPVFTRKINTDVSFLACAKKISENTDAFYPQFATHNAYSAAAVLALMKNEDDFEFQCLHGMGRPLYDQIVSKHPCRVYAPVGGYQDLLAYLVRRLLENGANTSFINRIVDDNVAINELVSSPVSRVKKLKHVPHRRIPLPQDIYQPARRNARGYDLSNPTQWQALNASLNEHYKKHWQALPLVANTRVEGEKQPIFDPSDTRRVAGSVIAADKKHADKALDNAALAFKQWAHTPVEKRINLLHRMADLLEEKFTQFMALAIREAGKTITDAIAEVREAIDFCRYYAKQANELLTKPQIMPGPTGEYNALTLHPRGIVICISPWNFPLAIFLGQVTAALAAGNVVIAKPAEQTPLIAYEAVRLLHTAGFPEDVVQLLPGDGATVGAHLVADERIAAVMFTGSTETAKRINKTLANRQGPIIPFIAETGGQNAMIADSTALPEQLIRDVMQSAFGSAGQRCSALRVLFLQADVSEKMLTMLQGAMAELHLGDPAQLDTDIGPVIDEEAKSMLNAHLKRMHEHAKLIYQTPLDPQLKQGHFVAPSAFLIPDIKMLTGEVFGPILHVITYRERDLTKVIESINQTGYGLTFGIHSRIQQKVLDIVSQVHAGNCYVNRSMTGAVVGVQPFGGEGLSGTGPKAGGPYYLLRLMSERTLSIDTTAAGGNASLLSLGD